MKTPASSKSIEVRGSAIHGRGVFATRDIPAGAAIGRYRGRRCSGDEASERSSEGEEVYLFGLSDGSFIDGARGGNYTRFINHSCVPNCVAFELHEEGAPIAVVIEALSPIAAGQELLLDYKLDLGGEDAADYACRCGARACRGTMAAPA